MSVIRGVLWLEIGNVYSISYGNKFWMSGMELVLEGGLQIGG